MASTASSLDKLMPMELYPYALYVDRWPLYERYKRYAKLNHMTSARTALRNRSYYRDSTIIAYQFNYDTETWEVYNA